MNVELRDELQLHGDHVHDQDVADSFVGEGGVRAVHSVLPVRDLVLLVADLDGVRGGAGGRDGGVSGLKVSPIGWR